MNHYLHMKNRNMFQVKKSAQPARCRPMAIDWIETSEVPLKIDVIISDPRHQVVYLPPSLISPPRPVIFLDNLGRGEMPQGQPPAGTQDFPTYDYRDMKHNRSSQADRTAGAQAPRGINPPHRILVVEDDGDIRRLNTDILIYSGYHVDAAEDGAAAWDTLQLNSYDLLITDNEMPKVSGVELLKKLHAVRMAMPVIMATGKLPEAEFTSHPWLQPTATLLKPFTCDELLGTVEKVLRVTDSAREQFERLPIRRSQPSANGLRL